MRLVEEKKSVRLQIISVVGLILTTILIQIITIKIDRVDREITVKALGVIATTQTRLYYTLGQQFDTLKAVLPFEKIVFHEDYWSSDNPSDEARQIKEQFEKGELDAKGYFIAMAEHGRKLSSTTGNELHERIREVNGLVRQKSWCEPLRSILFIVQIIAICILVRGYGDLLRTVSERTPKRQDE